jgi:hypothetical protein
MIYRKRKSEETYLQEWFATFLDGKGVLYCASTGGERAGVVRGAMNKRRGYKKGHPDIVIYETRGKYHGLTIELKMGAKITESQIWWQCELLRRGYLAVIMPRTLPEKTVNEYLSLPEPQSFESTEAEREKQAAPALVPKSKNK